MNFYNDCCITPKKLHKINNSTDPNVGNVKKRRKLFPHMMDVQIGKEAF